MIDNSELSFSIDEFVRSLQSLDRQAEAAPTRLLISEAEASGRFVKADLGAFRNREDGSIWKLDTGDDGLQYIVKTESDDTISQAGWTAAPNRTGDTITLSYLNVPVRKFTTSEFGFNPDNAALFASVIIAKATEEQPKFVKNILATLNFEDRIRLQKQFPIFRQG